MAGWGRSTLRPVASTYLLSNVWKAQRRAYPSQVEFHHERRQANHRMTTRCSRLQCERYSTGGCVSRRFPPEDLPSPTRERVDLPWHFPRETEHCSYSPHEPAKTGCFHLVQYLVSYAVTTSSRLANRGSLVYIDAVGSQFDGGQLWT